MFQFFAVETDYAKEPRSFFTVPSIVLSPPMLIVSRVLFFLSGRVPKIFLIDASSKMQSENILPKFVQFVNPAKLGVNSRKLVQPENILEASVRLLGSEPLGVLNEVNPVQPENIS